MSYQDWKHAPRRQGQPGNQSDPAPASPGKRSRTMGLPAQRAAAAQTAAPTGAAVQRRAQDQEATAQWTEVAFRPDVFAAPVQRKDAGTGGATAGGATAGDATAADVDAAALPEAITGANAAQVFQTIAAVDAGEQAAIAIELGRQRRKGLADNLERGDTTGDRGHAALRALFDNTPAAEKSTLIQWFQLRFGLETGPDTDGGIQWDKRGLIRSWDVFAALPPDHVEGNGDLAAYVRYRSGSIEGYADDEGTAAIGYGRGNDIHNETETGAYTDDGDPMRGTNVFDATVRHEVGHRVDPSVGGSAVYCRTAAGGSWQVWDDGSSMAAVMVAQSGGAILGWPDADEKAAIIAVLQGVIDDRAPAALTRRIARLPFVKDAGSDADQQKKLDSIKSDPVLDALRRCFSDQAPWDLPNGGVALSGRVFQETYEESEWASYAADARDRKVSRYQYRSPEEWFAEAYAAYYQPPGGKGALLKGRDDATKAWFDENVDPRRGAGAGSDKVAGGDA